MFFRFSPVLFVEGFPSKKSNINQKIIDKNFIGIQPWVNPRLLGEAGRPRIFYACGIFLAMQGTGRNTNKRGVTNSGLGWLKHVSCTLFLSFFGQDLTTESDFTFDICRTSKNCWSYWKARGTKGFRVLPWNDQVIRSASRATSCLVPSKAQTMQSAVVCTTVPRLFFSCLGDGPHSHVTECIQICGKYRCSMQMYM